MLDLVRGLFTFLMTPFLLGDGEAGLLCRHRSNSRKSPTPHRMGRMRFATQKVKLGLSHMALIVFSRRRWFFII